MPLLQVWLALRASVLETSMRLAFVSLHFPSSFSFFYSLFLWSFCSVCYLNMHLIVCLVLGLVRGKEI